MAKANQDKAAESVEAPTVEEAAEVDEEERELTLEEKLAKLSNQIASLEGLDAALGFEDTILPNLRAERDTLRGEVDIWAKGDALFDDYNLAVMARGRDKKGNLVRYLAYEGDGLPRPFAKVFAKLTGQTVKATGTASGPRQNNRRIVEEVKWPSAKRYCDANEIPVGNSSAVAVLARMGMDWYSYPEW